MRSIPRSLVSLTLILGGGCDTDEQLDLPEEFELESLDEPIDAVTPAAAAELGEDDWTEPPTGPDHFTDVTPPPSEDTCGGYWEFRAPTGDLGCGSCTHTVPEPDRPGALGLWHKRWCWTGTGCAGCEPWILTVAHCYDSCG